MSVKGLQRPVSVLDMTTYDLSLKFCGHFSSIIATKTVVLQSDGEALKSKLVAAMDHKFLFHTLSSAQHGRHLEDSTEAFSWKKMFWSKFHWGLMKSTIRISTGTGWGQAITLTHIFRCIFVNEKFWILIRLSLKYAPKGLIENKPALV